MQLTKLTKISTKGFTLIELLVVIAIIGLLATIVAAPIQSARKKAKDTKKLAEVRQMQTSLANYANDTGSYPAGSSTSAGAITTASIITSLAPQYIPSIPLGFTAANARDKYMYVAFQGQSPGATASTTFAYHLGATLEVYNTVLASDEDCWGVVSTTTSGVSGNKNGTACVTFVSADNSSTLNASYMTATNTPFVGIPSKTLNNVTSLAVAGTGYSSSTIGFNTYQQLGHPMWPSATADFQGFGTAEYATSTCTTVDQCVYDVSDSY